MKLFASRKVREALAWAAAGGQALHVHRFAPRPGAPRVFREAWARGEALAHLFDRDRERLVRTAQALGVQAVKVEREGTERQHVDLCAGPLKRALEAAATGRGRWGGAR